MIDLFQIVLFIDEQPPSAADLLKKAYPDVELEEFRKLPNHGSYGVVHQDGFTIAIQCQLSRVDVVIDRPSPEGEASTPFIEDTDLKLAFDTVTPAAKTLCDTLSVIRGAIILTKSQMMEDAAAATADILNQVPGLPYPEGALDVDYRINVPAQSKINGSVSYNRIARWFSAKRGVVQITPSQNSATSVSDDVSILSVDINIRRDCSIKEEEAEFPYYLEMFEMASSVLSFGMGGFK